MAKIRKIKEKELVGGTSSVEVYPITHTRAVYGSNNIPLSDTLEFLNTEIVWNNSGTLSNMNDFVTAGVYDIKGERTRDDDNLPFGNTGGGHTFHARLEVLDSSIAPEGQPDDICITQRLTLSNRLAGDGDVYIRTGRGANKEAITWETWGKLQQNIEVGEVTNLDNLIDNGIYSGVWTNGHLKNYPLTFVCVVINDYFIGTSPRRVSQFLYGLSKFNGSTVYQTRIWDDAYNKWSDWEIINKAEIDSLISTKVEELERAVNAKIETLIEGADPNTIDSIKDLINWVNTHGSTTNDIFTRLDNIQDKVDNNEADIEKIHREYVVLGSFDVQPEANQVEIDYSGADDTNAMFIPAATENLAGVMSAEDKKELSKATTDIKANAKAIEDEAKRATEAEAELREEIANAGTGDVTTEQLNAVKVDVQTNTTAINNEVTRATQAEQALSDRIDNIPLATADNDGLMSAEDKRAVDSIWSNVVADSVMNGRYATKTGVIDYNSNYNCYKLSGTGVRKVKVKVGGFNNSIMAVAFYSAYTTDSNTYISGVESAAGVRWLEVEVPAGCERICISNYTPALDEVIVLAMCDSQTVVDNQEKLKAFDPQQTLVCSNYLYTNKGTEGALTRIYYLTEQDNETIKGAFLTGMIVNVLGTGTLSLYLAEKVEFETRIETLVEDISVTQLGVQVIRFSKPIVVGQNQTFGFKMGFKHAVSTTYGAKGFMGVRYVYNGVFSSSNKDFGFGLVGMKKYDNAEQYPITRGVLGSSLNRINPYYDHLFIDKINGEDVIIPSESIYSVAISKRLGFDVIELNVNSTSDGQFVVMHGDGGKFGKQFEHIDGVTDISATAINSVTLAWIKENVRYKSIYAKYRTAPSTLEDMLYECKRNGIVPFVQRKDINVNGAWISSISVAHRIMGDSNFISYGGGNMREYAAPIYHFGSESSIEAILAVCDKCGAPFIYGINNPSRFTDEELVEIVNKLHSKGYFVAFAGSYQNEPFNQKLLAMGFDMSASGWNVPIFTDSNIVCADGFEPFTHNGSVNDGVLTLNAGNTVSILHSGDVPFLSVGLLQIRFKGKLNIKMGDYINDEFVSDGDSAMTLTTYYMEKAPVFSITAVEKSEIKDILFKASKR